LVEIKSCDILQPGPAALTDGLEQLHRHLAAWAHDLVGGGSAAPMASLPAGVEPVGAVRSRRMVRAADGRAQNEPEEDVPPRASRQ
jgi:hypothetical protein